MGRRPIWEVKRKFSLRFAQGATNFLVGYTYAEKSFLGGPEMVGWFNLWPLCFVLLLLDSLYMPRHMCDLYAKEGEAPGKI